MQTVLLDTGILVPPRPDDDISRVHEYVESLQNWTALLKESWWISVRLSEKTSSELFDNDEIPDIREAIRSAFEAHEVFEYDANTVAWNIDRLLNQMSFEDDLKIYEILHDGFSSDLDLSKLTVGSTLIQYLERRIIMVSILRNHCNINEDSISLIVKNTAGSNKIQIRAAIHEIEHDRQDMGDIPYQPKILKGDVIVFDRFFDLLNSMDEVKNWRENLNIESESGLLFAIKIAIFKDRLSRNIKVEWPIEIPIILGSKFISRAKACCKRDWNYIVPNIFRCIINIVDHNRKDVHELRKSKSTNDDQEIRSRDLAKAWRGKIGLDNRFRLHYWERKDGVIELASMGIHDDYSIPE